MELKVFLEKKYNKLFNVFLKKNNLEMYIKNKYNEDNNKVISFLDLSKKDFYKIKYFINNIK